MRNADQLDVLTWRLVATLGASVNERQWLDARQVLEEAFARARKETKDPR